MNLHDHSGICTDTDKWYQTTTFDWSIGSNFCHRNPTHLNDNIIDWWEMLSRNALQTFDQYVICIRIGYRQTGNEYFCWQNFRCKFFPEKIQQHWLKALSLSIVQKLPFFDDIINHLMFAICRPWVEKIGKQRHFFWTRHFFKQTRHFSTIQFQIRSIEPETQVIKGQLGPSMSGKINPSIF